MTNLKTTLTISSALLSLYLLGASSAEVGFDLDSFHTCQVFGDSHVTTFDGKRYSVWGGSDCTYVLALDCYYASWLVYVRFVNCGEASRSVSSIVLFKQDSVVMLSRGWQVYGSKGEVYMREGRPRHMGNGLFVELFPEYLRVQFKTDSEELVTVYYDGWSTVTLKTQAATVCGLCGNNNGNTADEFFNTWFHGESIIEKPSNFVSSWKVDQGKECNAIEQIKSQNAFLPISPHRPERGVMHYWGAPSSPPSAYKLTWSTIWNSAMWTFAIVWTSSRNILQNARLLARWQSYVRLGRSVERLERAAWMSRILFRQTSSLFDWMSSFLLSMEKPLPCRISWRKIKVDKVNQSDADFRYS